MNLPFNSPYSQAQNWFVYNLFYFHVAVCIIQTLVLSKNRAKGAELLELKQSVALGHQNKFLQIIYFELVDSLINGLKRLYAFFSMSWDSTVLRFFIILPFILITIIKMYVLSLD